MTEKWSEVQRFLEPKAPLYCPETPSLTQRVFLRTNTIEALFGGMAGGGKSSALLMAALQYVDVPGYAAMLFRRTFADLKLPGALMDRFITWIAPHPEIRWNASEYVATFPSGARIGFGYLNNKDDYLRYKGSEVQFVGMDEVTEIREDDYTYMFSRMRRPAHGPLSKVPMRMRCASNPAPNWVRQRFIVEGKKEGRIFVPSSFEENPGVDADAYRETLARLNPVERKRLQFGDWWVATFGTMFAREDFIVVEPGEMPIFSPHVKAVRFWDFAATEPTPDNKNPDWTVGTLMAMDEGKFYVLDVKKCRKQQGDVEKLVQATAAADGLGVAIRMEQEPGSSGKGMVDNFARKVLPGYNFKGYPATGSKETRALPLSSSVSNGLVHVVTAEWNTDWFDEICSFPEANDHDDQVDSVSGAFTDLTGFGGKARNKASLIV